MFARRLALGLLLALASAAPASAGFTLSIGSTSINSGGTASVDVMITGPQLLDFFVGEYRITPISSAPTAGVQFATLQTDFSSNGNYAFFGNTSGLTQTVTTTTSTNDTLTVLDGTTDFAGVDVSSTRLLARLDLTATNGLPANAQYRIELIAGGTSFLDPDGNPVDYTSNFGTVTVVDLSEPNPVPAPPGLVLLATGLVPAVVLLRQFRQSPVLAA